MNAALSTQESRRLGELTPVITKAGYAVGTAGLIATLIVGLFDPPALYKAWLLNFSFFLSLMLGGIFFTVIHHLTRAGWSTAIRRIAETLGANVPLMALFTIPIFLGLYTNSLYSWTQPDGDHLLEWKTPYLNTTFFTIRMAGYFLAWFLISRFYYRTSVAQDASGDPNLTLKMTRFAPISIILFALTTTFASFDLLMSLDPKWFSTIFGVYYFAGSVGAFFAVMILALMLLQHAGVITESVTIEHYHDLGKYVFAFIVFWAYIAYSQYMLIWYGNIPEETVWFQTRLTGPWQGFTAFLLFGHFIGPFLFLMSRKMKRRGMTLAVGVAWMLLMHWIDLYWLIKPVAGVNSLSLHFVDLTAFAGIGGFFVAVLARRLGRTALVPERDPRLVESLAFENY